MSLRLSMIAFLFRIFHQAFALPRSISGRQAERISNTTLPQFEAVVRDHNGLDITSLFQVMLYQEQKPVQNSSLHNRQPQFSPARPVKDCEVPNSYFRRSYCTPEDGVAGSLQKWTIYCHLSWDLPVWLAANRDGYCEDYEYCVDGFDFNAYNQLTHVALCVNRAEYLHYQEPASSRTEIEFGGRRANVMVSKSDKTTPLEVDSLTVQAGLLDQSRKCRDYVELSTDIFQADTERLKTEVELLTTGAVTGIMLLALMSG